MIARRCGERQNSNGQKCSWTLAMAGRNDRSMAKTEKSDFL
jgi:hypothetical protein